MIKMCYLWNSSERMNPKNPDLQCCLMKVLIGQYVIIYNVWAFFISNTSNSHTHFEIFWYYCLLSHEDIAITYFYAC